MSKINETNYPRRPQSDYEDTDMLIIQEADGNTYTTRIEDIREDCQEAIAPIVEAVNDALAPPENGSTASQSYAIGEHFMRNGDFCTAIAAITSGASFTLNTNYVVGTIAEALESLNSDLASKANCITIDSAVTSPYFFYSVDGATALFGAIPSLYMGLCYARFKNSINTICLVNKANGAYGTIILMNDIGSAPLLISVSGGTLTVKDFTVS